MRCPLCSRLTWLDRLPSTRSVPAHCNPHALLRLETHTLRRTIEHHRDQRPEAAARRAFIAQCRAQHLADHDQGGADDAVAGGD
uniref:Uncharacterized protein n=2 Tax=unclassified Mycobacterium TaxID=2642494 RepID=A1UJR7_MYCSK